MGGLSADLVASLMLVVDTLTSRWQYLRERMSDAQQRRVEFEFQDEFQTIESNVSSSAAMFANIVDTDYQFRAKEFIRSVERIRAECEVSG
jgi:hypothetical protein